MQAEGGIDRRLLGEVEKSRYRWPAKVADTAGVGGAAGVAADADWAGDHGRPAAATRSYRRGGGRLPAGAGADRNEAEREYLAGRLTGLETGSA